MIVMTFTVEIDIGLPFLLQFAPPLDLEPVVLPGSAAATKTRAR